MRLDRIHPSGVAYGRCCRQHSRSHVRPDIDNNVSQPQVGAEEGRSLGAVTRIDPQLGRNGTWMEADSVAVLSDRDEPAQPAAPEETRDQEAQRSALAAHSIDVEAERTHVVGI